jgi:hypothetical protein
VRLRLGRPTPLTVDFADDEIPVTVTGTVGFRIFQGRTAALTDPNPVADLAATGTGPYAVLWTPLTLGLFTGYWYFTGGYRRLFFEVTEAPIVSVKDVRAFDPVLADPVKFPTGLVLAARDSVEEEFEQITNRSFTIRSRDLKFTTFGGSYNSALPDDDVQRVAAFTVNGSDGTSLITQLGPAWIDVTFQSGFVDVDTQEFAMLYAAEYDCELVYEYGMSPPPADVRRAALLRIRDVLVSINSAIPDRATTFQVTEFGTYSLATAGRNGFDTGLPEVDAILSRYKSGNRWAV